MRKDGNCIFAVGGREGGWRIVRGIGVRLRVVVFVVAVSVVVDVASILHLAPFSRNSMTYVCTFGIGG